MRDIEELKDLVSLVVEIVDAGVLIFQDGHIGLGDVGHVWDVIEKMGPAFIGIDEVPAELKDLSIEECDNLITLLESELTVLPAQSKDALDKILKATRACYEVYLVLKG